MHQPLVIFLIFGLCASIYALDLSHAAQPATPDVDPRILNFINDFYAQVIYPPLNHIVTNTALLGAQILAGIGINGLPAPGGRTIHLTEAELRGFWSGLWNDALKPPIENALSGISLMAAQLLAGVGINGVDLTIGKRDLTAEDARFIDALTQAFNNVFTNVIQKPLEDALSGGALMLAQILAGLGTNGVNLADLGSLFGKRDLTADEAAIRGILNNVGGVVVNGLQSVWNSIFAAPLGNFIQNGALAGAQILAGLGTNGVNLGKRAAETRGPITDSLLEHASGLYINQVKPVLENALNNAALHLAGVLANFSQNGFGRR